MRPPLHLIIAGARIAGSVAPSPALVPNLTELLSRMRGTGSIVVADCQPAPPQEIAYAAALNLPTTAGLIPWAAFDTGTTRCPCAWFMPVHLEAQMRGVTLTDPKALNITADQSRALFEDCSALLASEGLSLQWIRPDAWLAKGQLLRGLRCWSVLRALGRNLEPQQRFWVPGKRQIGKDIDDGKDAREGPDVQDMQNAQIDQIVQDGKNDPNDASHQEAILRRLACELEMLLHSHPVNLERERGDELALNALWIHGAGQLTDLPTPEYRVIFEDRLLWAPRERPALWQQIDSGPMAQLLAAAQAGGPARLTLCGPRRARSWQTKAGSGFARSIFLPVWLRTLAPLFAHSRLRAALEGL